MKFTRTVLCWASFTMAAFSMPSLDGTIAMDTCVFFLFIRAHGFQFRVMAQTKGHGDADPHYKVLHNSAMDGAASKDELRQLFQRYCEQRDEQKLGTLVYWRNVRQRERSGFLRSLRNDLKYRLKKVELVALDPHTGMDYTFKGITFRAALPPIGRMVATYEGQGNVKDFTTSYLIGEKDGRYYIDLAVPAKSPL